MIGSTSWSIVGAEGETILGDAHSPPGEPCGVVLLTHGFKGYKDYGMFPRLASALAAAGFIVHRFNFSHSGMTNEAATFARPDLFENDTWNKQVEDLRAVMRAVLDGVLPGRGLPTVLFGHSRGGVSVLLAAGRHAHEKELATPAGIITAAASDQCHNLSERELNELRTFGFLESPSARTGQALRVGRVFIDEQLADPAGHDLLAVAGRVHCPVLIVHGDRDPTVPSSCAVRLAAAIGQQARALIIPGADHVFNTPNPLPAGADASPQLCALISAAIEFAGNVCDSPSRCQD
jgi:alpha-beta hydrolase superfamily lysophospholipase